MTIHYIVDLRQEEFYCGASAIGRRHPSMQNMTNADCILCRAMIDRKPVYAVATVDEDGNYDIAYFPSIRHQVDYSNECIGVGAFHMMYVLLPDEIPSDPWQERLERAYNRI